MSSPTQTKAKLETAKSSDHTGVTASYTALGSALQNPSLGIFIASTFNQSVWISTDGTTDKILIPAGSSSLIPFASLSPGDRGIAFAQGTQFYIKQGPDGAPTSGDLALTSIYGD